MSTTHEITILDQNGDSKHVWDADNEIEVEAMRKLFADYKAKGYAAYAVEGKEGTKGKLIREFDPELERIIFAPQMRGG
jgi:hypothetical protein